MFILSFFIFYLHYFYLYWTDVIPFCYSWVFVFLLLSIAHWSDKGLNSNATGWLAMSTCVLLCCFISGDPLKKKKKKLQNLYPFQNHTGTNLASSVTWFYCTKKLKTLLSVMWERKGNWKDQFEVFHSLFLSN